MAQQRFGAGGYQVFLYSRGLADMIGLVTGWTQLQWDWRRSDIGQATVSFGNIGTASDECRSMFQTAQSWQHELVIARSDGFTWTGPIIARGASGGTGVITAAQISQWGLRRKVHSTHKITKGDATDAYAALWHDAVDVENGMNWQLVITAPLGDTIPITINATDRQMFATAVQTLTAGGLDTVTDDRQTFVGPPDTTYVDGMLTDTHLTATPDFTEDGMQQADVYGVLGQSSGTDATPYYEATSGTRDVHGLLETVVQSTTAQTQRQARREALQGIRTKADARPVLSSISLRPNAPFTVPMLRPGRLWNVRLSLTPLPISDTYRIAKVAVTVDASQAGGETIQIDVDQSNVDA